jgi:hypothetical protein
MADDLRTTSRQLERDPMSADEARKLTDQIKFDAGPLWDKLTEAYHGRADVALSYESWDTYCIAEFGSLRLRLPREERAEMVCSLRQSGLSNRAIAAVTGVSEGTVRNDLGAQNYDYAPEPWFAAGADPQAEDEDALTELRPAMITTEPVRVRLTKQLTTTAEPVRVTPVIIGLDGKTYQPPERKPQPKPVPPSDAELFDEELVKLDGSVDHMMRLIDRGRLREDERTVLAGRVADYSGRLQVIAHKLRGEQVTSA